LSRSSRAGRGTNVGARLATLRLHNRPRGAHKGAEDPENREEDPEEEHPAIEVCCNTTKSWFLYEQTLDTPPRTFELGGGHGDADIAGPALGGGSHFDSPAAAGSLLVSNIASRLSAVREELDQRAEGAALWGRVPVAA
jgi:hypothetical protein